MENTLSVLFYLRKSNAQENAPAPIYTRITVNGSRVDLSLYSGIIWIMEQGASYRSLLVFKRLKGSGQVF